MTDVEDVVERLRGVPTATVCDAVIKLGIGLLPERLVMRGVRALVSPTQTAVGIARTQQIGRLRDRTKTTLVTDRPYAFSFVDGAGTGDFLVIGVPPGEDFAVIGDVIALRAHTLGAVAMATDGAVRDVTMIAALGLPVWGAATTPLPAGYGGLTTLGIDVPISCGGAEVAPGDVVVGDGDGVVVIPAEHATTIADACLAMEEAEVEARAAITAGRPLIEVYPSRAYYGRPQGER